MKERLQAMLGLLRTRQTTVDGLSLQVPPGVQDPVLFRSGAWFSGVVAAQVAPGDRVLDLGCGTGVVGLACQRAGAEVVASDVEAAAVTAARTNGLCDVRRGDLFATVGGERFAHVAFNPPYFVGRVTGRWPARRALARSLYGGAGLDVVVRFASEAPAHLATGGRVWLCWSDRAPATVPALLGPGWSLHAEAVLTDERLSAWVWPRATAG